MKTSPPVADGIHAMLPREQMHPLARKRRDTYAITPGLPFVRTEFWLMETTLRQWKKQGMPEGISHEELFLLDGPSDFGLGSLGWCEAAFCPKFEEKVLEDRGDCELVQDFAGRGVLCFKGRREGFMPEYVTHPVKDMKSWEETCKWRLDPKYPERWEGFDTKMSAAASAAMQGYMIVQNMVGGYMYLRSLIGPEELLFAFYDQPQLIHDCMKAWLDLADYVIARHQEHVTLDELFLAEDICYNHGGLIGPEMMQEFLLPYYPQLIANAKHRQIDRSRHLYVQIDTDGDCRPTIPIYMQSIGMDAMSPFEVTSGCDVVEIGRQYPNLVLRGGLDKRVVSQGRKAIDQMLERIIPPMRQRGGYIPSLDHGVPNETPYENYLYFRNRCVELGG